MLLKRFLLYSTFILLIILSSTPLNKYYNYEAGLLEKFSIPNTVEESPEIIAIYQDIKKAFYYISYDQTYKGLELFETALKKIKVPSYYYDLLFVYVSLLKDFGEKEKAFSILKSIDTSKLPKELISEYYIELSDSYRLKDDFKNVRKYIAKYEKAIGGTINSIRSVRYVINKTYILEKEGKSEEAIKLLKNYIYTETSPDDMAMDYLLKFLYYYRITNKRRIDPENLKEFFYSLIYTKKYDYIYEFLVRNNFEEKFFAELLVNAYLDKKGDVWKIAKQSKKLEIVLNFLERGEISILDGVEDYEIFSIALKGYIVKSLEKLKEMTNENEIENVLDYLYRIYQIFISFYPFPSLSTSLTEILIKYFLVYKMYSEAISVSEMLEEKVGRLSSGLYFFRGCAYEELGDLKKAEENFEKSIAVNPTDYYAFLSYTKLREIHKGDWDSYVDNVKYRINLPRFSLPLDLLKTLYIIDPYSRKDIREIIKYKEIYQLFPYLVIIPSKFFRNWSSEEGKKIHIYLRYKLVYLVWSKLDRKGFSNVLSNFLILKFYLEKGEYSIWSDFMEMILFNRAVREYIVFFPEELQQLIFPTPRLTLVFWASKEFGIDPALIFGIMKQESKFMSSARSFAGAVGLMQLIYTTANLFASQIFNIPLEKEELYMEERNVLIATAYLSHLLQVHKDLLKSLAIYNGGYAVLKNTIQKYPILKDKPSYILSEFLVYRETRNYVKVVVRNFWIYTLLYREKFESLLEMSYKELKPWDVLE